METSERIELFGFPGSGKTTSLEKVNQLHTDFFIKQANVSFTIKNGFSLLIYILIHPKSFALFAWLKYVPLSSYKAYLNTIIRFILRVKSLENDIKAKERCIVDEGLLQISWSLLLLPAIYNDRFDLEKKLEYLKNQWWKEIDMLVYHLDISDEEYLKRIQSRERLHFFSKHFINKDEKIIQKGKNIAGLILKQANSYYKIKTL